MEDFLKEHHHRWLRSLNKIRSLPDDTKIYCAHEYTEANSRFANHLTPDDSLLKKKIIEIKRKEIKKYSNYSFNSLRGKKA